MPDHKQVYNREAQNYQRLVAREDYHDNLLRSIQDIINPNNLDVVDLGAGTGRLACLLAPFARSVYAFDLSPHMLSIASSRLIKKDLNRWLVAASDHRRVPLNASSADLVVSGWSFCYLVVWEEKNWKTALEAGLQEINRLLREKGTIVIIESLGTGIKRPEPSEKLKEYFQYLEARGFHRTWLRTDYEFQDMEEARELVQFFFGEEMLEKINDEPRPVLPECTGIWWTSKSHLSKIGK